MPLLMANDTEAPMKLSNYFSGLISELMSLLKSMSVIIHNYIVSDACGKGIHIVNNTHYSSSYMRFIHYH